MQAWTEIQDGHDLIRLLSVYNCNESSFSVFTLLILLSILLLLFLILNGPVNECAFFFSLDRVISHLILSPGLKNHQSTRHSITKHRKNVNESAKNIINYFTVLISTVYHICILLQANKQLPLCNFVCSPENELILCTLINAKSINLTQRYVTCRHFHAKQRSSGR